LGLAGHGLTAPCSVVALARPPCLAALALAAVTWRFFQPTAPLAASAVGTMALPAEQ